ncbi:putative fad binding domain protein [Phaeoacremonium minimum UCRPA7]|uniref:Putative fad binding domain protein n=1 Tax=Phaeoacremonium minimum (strain UCR-PA7) TaxID=1286976 RepID=R8B8I8_PHAM7|nr:putative fad binding domain protein [Phaeoacremonium minimum UCRPA7]EON95608.1 putative fad binding domain protein [Phaeoacremonium minimum UCRPA7]
MPSTSFFAAVLAAASVLPQLALGQTIDDGSDTVAATNETVAPAVATVDPSTTDLDADYFGFEAAQLTTDVIANLTSLNLTDAAIFDFADGSEASKKRSLCTRNSLCKVLPGDKDWPSTIQWLLLDLLTGGALEKGVPSAAVCYKDWPQYNAAQCADITANWTSPKYQMEQPTGVDFPLYEGVTCLPPTLSRTGANCTLGGYPSYVLSVTNVAQIQLAFNFARNLNVRLNVKNKGHDFNGKSTGAGSLSIWTHHLQDIRYISKYTTSTYSGAALKIGAGVQAEKVYQFADSKGLQVVGGIARTVGLGGGYIAGGGHSPLMSVKGMAADQVLALEAVLPDGRFVSVDEKTNSDLFWALRGGGGSTFGVVTSLVIAAYPKVKITTLTYSFSTSDTVDMDTFWAGVDVFWTTFPAAADAGHYRYFTLLCLSADSCSFSMGPHWANGMNTAQLTAFNAPFFANLSALGIDVTDQVYTEYDGVYNAFTNTFAESTEVVGGWSYHTGSRLFPRSNWNDSSKLAVQSSAIRKAAQDAGMMLGYNFAPATNPSVNQDNAVNPAWRNTLMHGMLGATWGSEATPAEIAAASKTLTDRLQTWRDASPGAGAYMNEADINEPNFQQSFYGTNYDRLYTLKQKYDPWGVLYAITAVGSEDWYVTGQIPYYPTQNGRLCKVSA